MSKPDLPFHITQKKSKFVTNFLLHIGDMVQRVQELEPDCIAIVTSDAEYKAAKKAGAKSIIFVTDEETVCVSTGTLVMPLNAEAVKYATMHWSRMGFAPKLPES